jgi:hypothetical protein
LGNQIQALRSEAKKKSVKKTEKNREANAGLFLIYPTFPNRKIKISQAAQPQSVIHRLPSHKTADVSAEQMREHILT